MSASEIHHNTTTIKVGRHSALRSALALAVTAVLVLSATPVQAQGGSILFIGNSFTFGWGSPVRYYRADTVTDLNGEGFGGMPALFKSFTVQAGLDYDVQMETHPGIGIDWHLDNKLGTIGQRPWNTVVMHGFSTLDPKKPGDPTVLISTAKQMAEFLAVRNAAVDVRVMATWARADQTYDSKGAWYGKPIEAMAKDVRDGYDKAAASTSLIKGVVPVGQAWTRAIQSGVADANPYDGVDAGKVNRGPMTIITPAPMATTLKPWSSSGASRAVIRARWVRMNARASSLAYRPSKWPRWSRLRMTSWPRPGQSLRRRSS